MKSVVIGDEFTVAGFGLVGVHGLHVSTGQEAQRALEEALRTPDLGLIIITERLAEEIREQLDRLIAQFPLPLILEVPDRGGPLDKPDTALRFLGAVGEGRLS